MRNCIILGAGRSGTSMVAGVLSGAGYFMGDNLYPPRGSNPKGFFEGPQINGINEALLAPIVPVGQRLGRGQRWLAELPAGTMIPAPGQIRRAMQEMTAKTPWCYKDPRFSHTLPAWRRFLGDAVFICVFRDPAVTAASIVRECADAAYLHGVDMTPGRALGIWRSVYRQITGIHRHHGDWLFLHFDQVLDGDGIQRLRDILGADVDEGFPDPDLRRTAASVAVPDEIAELYAQLRQLAGMA